MLKNIVKITLVSYQLPIIYKRWDIWNCILFQLEVDSLIIAQKYMKKIGINYNLIDILYNLIFSVFVTAVIFLVTDLTRI